MSFKRNLSAVGFGIGFNVTLLAFFYFVFFAWQ